MIISERLLKYQFENKVKYPTYEKLQKIFVLFTSEAISEIIFSQDIFVPRKDGKWYIII